VREALENFTELGWILGDVMLVASELVTNAVLHSGSIGDDHLDVEIHLGAEQISIAVCDPGRSGEVASVRPAGEFAFGGWGLQIVEQLASRWGTRRTRGYEVWAELDRQAAAEPSQGSDTNAPVQTGRGVDSAASSPAAPTGQLA
jgi:hypothetical protein